MKKLKQELKKVLLQIAVATGIDTTDCQGKTCEYDDVATAGQNSYVIVNNQGLAIADSFSTAIAACGKPQATDDPSVAIVNNNSLAIADIVSTNDHSFAIATKKLYIGDDCTGIIYTDIKDLDKVEFLAGNRSSITIIVEDDPSKRAFHFQFRTEPNEEALIYEAYYLYKLEVDRGMWIYPKKVGDSIDIEI